MTDHPTSASNTPADPPQEGGWHKPQASGGWQTPQVPKTDEGGWRAPQRLAPVAVQEGWRTINEADDSGTVEAPAELLPHDDSPVQEAQVETSAAEAAEQTVLPYDDAPLPLDEALPSLLHPPLKCCRLKQTPPLSR